MKRLMKNIVLVLACASLLVGGASKASTNVVSETANYGPATSDWTNSFVLQQFNPALGSLQSVFISAAEDIDVNGTVVNNKSSSANFKFQSGSLLTVTLPGLLGTLQPNPMGVVSTYKKLAGFASASYGPTQASGSANTLFTLPADMAWFTGTGTFSLPSFTQVQNLITGGGGKISPSLVTTASGSVRVEYTFITAVPEPASLSLLVLGGAMLLLRKRR